MIVRESQPAPHWQIAVENLINAVGDRRLADVGADRNDTSARTRRVATIPASQFEVTATPVRYWRSPRYLREELIELNFVLSALPTPLTPATITMLRPAAMMQYSIAVRPARRRKTLTTIDTLKTPADAISRILLPVAEGTLG